MRSPRPSPPGVRSPESNFQPHSRREFSRDSKTGFWRPDTQHFIDPATGLTIKIDQITNYDPADPSDSSYTSEDVAGITVTKTGASDLARNVILSNVQLKGLMTLGDRII